MLGEFGDSGLVLEGCRDVDPSEIYMGLQHEEQQYP